ncbi:MAG TPA: hypothetical protein VK175_04335 [Leadbetterella sp.]|nr:hypothetical protein [Leadbetterella sp.]
MAEKFSFKNLLPHLAVVVLFAILSVVYMSPVLSGKVLRQSDTVNGHAAQSEIRKYEKENKGEYIGWTNSMFSGMPTYFIGGDYSKGVFIKLQPFIYNIFGQNGTYLFLYMIGAYILLISLRANLISSFLGSIAYAFFSYNVLIIEAGHLAKVYALAFVPLMLAGLVLTYRGKIWLGAILFSFGVGMELNANHFQITYYSAFIILIFGIFELIRSIRAGQVKQFFIGTSLCIAMGLIAVGTNSARLMTTNDYSKYTMRGGSELKQKADAAKSGLEKEYAYEWSYGKLESFTFLIPNFSGGASGGVLDNKSESFKVLTGLGVDQGQAGQFIQGLPTYWGDQMFVGGTTYVGAILCFLFILSLFFVEARYRNPFVISAILCLFISWGGNFTILNNLFFDYLPLFNKFRAVSMILSLFQLCLVVLVSLGLHNILQNPPSWEKFKRPLYISVGVTAGLCLIFALMPSILDVTVEKDSQFKDALKQSFGDNTSAVNSLYNALIQDRYDLISSDAWRSLILIVLVAGILWVFVNGKLKNSKVVGGLIVLLCLVDLWQVDKRYLNTDDFVRKIVNRDDQFTPTAADLQIQQDKALSFRVIDVTASPFNNALTSVYHKSIGGYSAAKLSRYNDLIENQISKNNMAVLNMLNTKYFITPGQNGTPVVQQNPSTLGNAWFVSSIRQVTTPDEEIKNLDSLDAKNVAVVDISKFPEVKKISPSSSNIGTIVLTSYHPDHLIYEFESPSPQVVIFSEIFYKGNIDWISKIDGKKVDHFRANYVLRGLEIPAGKHQVTFDFEPVTISQGQVYDRYASIAWGILVLGCLFMNFRGTKKS